MTTTEIESIPPGERRELRSVVRAQFKVLRAEVEQRKTELLAEGEERLRLKYLAADKKTAELNRKVRAIADAAQKKIDAAIVASGIEDEGARFGSRPGMLRVDYISPRQDPNRHRLADSFRTAVFSQARTALVAIDRQEADLLRSLATDGLKTEQGRAFLGQILDVTALMPSEKLREVEAAFDRSAA